MIKASLTFHQPETIYEFLQKNIGPFFMVIKAGHAIINFIKSEHANIALSKYYNTTLLGMPLKLTPFKEEDLKLHNRTQNIVPQKSTQPTLPISTNQVKDTIAGLSEFTTLMQQTLKISDPQNFFEVATKNTKKQVIEYVNSYNLLSTAQQKRQQIINNYASPAEQQQKIQDFASFYKNGLTNLAQNLKKQFKNFRRRSSKFGHQQENIEVEPNIQINHIPKTNLVELTTFQNSLQFITLNGFQIKRIAALNQRQFICSLNNRHSGNLSFYKIEDQYSEMNFEIKEGAYGLLVLENHILVGTMQGYIAFFNTKDFSQRELSTKLHNGLIYELVDFGKRSRSHNVISLSGDNSLKIWNVAEMDYGDNSSTIFFEESWTLKDQFNKINSVDVIDSKKITYAKSKAIYLHDCQSNRIISSQNTKGMVLKVAKVNQQYIAAANQRYLSFIDIRNNAQTINYDITKEVKTVTVLSQYSVFYGCCDGEVGLIDRRSESKSYWKTNTIHKSKIYDVCRLNNIVLTGDNAGQLASWIPNQMPSRNGIVKQYK